MERKQMSTKGLKSKLTAALCMLLVGVTLVVSATYAWVVLSTAPEVKGIDTNIGANGALEIWLNEGQGDNYFGSNLVDFSQGDYGFDAITLLPAQLDKTSDGKLEGNFLRVPYYQANGVHSDSFNKKMGAGTWQSKEFKANDGTGVRGVGLTSEMNARQMAYNSAKNAVTDNMTAAQKRAKSSLAGEALTGILVKGLLGSSYTTAELDKLGLLIGDLEAATKNIEDAYEQTILAIAASALLDSNFLYDAIKADFASDSLTIAQIAADRAITVGEQTLPIPSEGDVLFDGMAALEATKAQIADAKAALAALRATGAEAYTEDEVKEIVTLLMNKDYVKLNGQPITKEIVEELMDGGSIVVTLEAGSGAYADIAAQCGEYSANVKVAGYAATMVAKSGGTVYATLIATALNNAGEPISADGELSDVPMEDFYGLIVDLGFITNAKNSHLLLQTEGVDRIDEENSTAATRGEGSYMSYWSEELDEEKIKNLMGFICIVFFDTETRTVLGEAKLAVDEGRAVVNEDGKTGWQAYMYLEKNGQRLTGDDAQIIKLEQNKETYVSALVYIDGTEMSNRDVAAEQAQSLFGKMNLQFASDADLKPMNYGELVQ